MQIWKSIHNLGIFYYPVQNGRSNVLVYEFNDSSAEELVKSKSGCLNFLVLTLIVIPCSIPSNP